MHTRPFYHKTITYLIAAILAVTYLLVLRTQGLYPSVFADEYTYSKLARLVPFSEAIAPDYLYFAIYRLTSICGDGFLGCARILNIAFFVSAAPFIYLLGRKLAGEKTALLISVLSILGPLNIYTAYFMPEALYFFSFWVFTWFLLNIKQKHGIWHWILIGVFFGLLTLIKPHALFLMPALAIYFLIIHRQQIGRGSNTKFFKYCVVFFASSIATKLVIGYIFAGISGVTLFGPTYTSHASTSIENSNRYFALARAAFINIHGHLLGLAVLFSVPISHLLLSSKNFFRRQLNQSIASNTVLYASLVFFVLLAVTAVFTASVSTLGPYETDTRLHMRYYNFAFPLLFLIAVSQLSPESSATRLRSRIIVAFPLGLAILYVIKTRMAPYTPSIIDSPELRGFILQLTVFYVLSGISILALALWVYKARVGAKAFVYLFLPLAIISSTFYTNNELRYRRFPNVFDNAGMFTKSVLSNEELSKVVVVSSNPAGLFRALFYLDNPKASRMRLPRGRQYDLSKLPADKEWLLVIGDHSLPEKQFFQLPNNGFSLVRVAGKYTIDFTKSSWLGVISSARGLSLAEPWGTWSSGDVVTLEFSLPLPEKFTVHLTAYASGPNVGKEFVARVGGKAIKFSLGPSTETKVLEFSDTNHSKIIQIEIPSPTSPKELGLSDDERSLGIAFTELRITPL